MLVGKIKEIIKRRCNRSPILTNEYLTAMATYVMQDVSLETKIMHKSTDITCVQDTYEYALPQTTLMINKVVYGDPNMPGGLSNVNNLTLRDPQRYNIIWKTDPGGNVYVPYLQFLTNPSGGWTARVFYNDLSDSDFDFTNDTANFDSIVNPIMELAMIDGIVAFYKSEFERNALWQLSMELYEKRKNTICGIYNADITFL